MKIKIYVEGGGDTRDLKSRCRRGFSEFFRKAGLEDRMPRIIASGGRQQAFDDFCTALEQSGAADFIVLLVDSEAPVADGIAPWTHLQNQDGWDRPSAAGDDNAHLMVQCMEAWLIADRERLAAFFAEGFSAKSLPARTAVENIPKPDLYAALKNATRTCRKGRYGKGRHSFDILAQVDPAKVLTASPFARRLVATLTQMAAA